MLHSRPASELVTRIGNQSNLILDPDLDSYYTMSLILLRYPVLLDSVAQLTPRLHDVVAGVAIDPAERVRLFVLEGELRSVANAIRSDYAEATASSQPLLRERLAPAQCRARRGDGRLRRAGAPRGRAANACRARQLDAAEAEVLDALDSGLSRRATAS